MLALILNLLLVPQGSLPAYRPTTAQIAAAYKRADTIGAVWNSQAFLLKLEPHWLDGGKSFWYRTEESDGTSSYVRVESTSGVEAPLFDHAAVAAALQKEVGQTMDPKRLPIQVQTWRSEELRFAFKGVRYSFDPVNRELHKVDANRDEGRRPQGPAFVQDTWPPSRTPVASPDGSWTARIEGMNILIKPKGGDERPLTKDGSDSAYYARLTWAPDSRRLVAIRVHPGDRKKVYLIQSTPPVWGPAKLSERIYDRPGDAVDTFDVITLDPSGASEPVAAEAVDYGDLPSLHKTLDGAFTYEKMDRGYGRYRIFRLNPATGQTTTIFDDDPPTFVDSTSQVVRYLEKTDEVIVSSERGGWHHLYLADGHGGFKQITSGPWVVRSVVNVDEGNRRILFGASGMDPTEDPYFVHYYLIDFDGSHLQAITPSRGNHRASLSPDGAVFVDTYSTVLEAPVHELRRADTGALVKELGRADVTLLRKGGWRPPQPFVAKGRDGKTDIYGLVFRPTNFDRHKRYPVIEDIYAGPHDSFVPKDFSANYYQQRIADIGFIVVKIDGMGTRNRSKAFHDVCYRNLADAGFPDRILWMKALGKSDPSVDLSRVGIFGTSAGGQSAGGAVLFHPEFYKVAVASCGCHDNRLDKIWWNEQWMGVIGPHYAASSNIENAAKLQGDLMLIVGELDTNVPPESTYRFAAALQAAGKEFELVVIPNSDHTSGGTYGERKRRDFFVRKLLGVEPPNPNRPSVA
ncbi:MAG: S9 family peptidase [Armatimonadetes bacterium]|nr:S9 family peptidase [Armatimonadota bacterium]